ncbi:MAG: NUDIX domain-containing protein [Ruminococcaceae bacterium]|nr:NUDIX domain-containing protein [Oscillospiraceae bacterium]
MRLLFEIDTKDYDLNGTAFVRPSARCIIVKDGKVAMVHSIKYNYYKFPGGGIEGDESKEEAVIRETLEETGLKIIPESIKEFGYVHRIQKNDYPDADYFVQDNYYYFCDVKNSSEMQKLDDYEADEQFTLEYIEPSKAILINRTADHGSADLIMIERESKVLEILEKEGYLINCDL